MLSASRVSQITEKPRSYRVTNGRIKIKNEQRGGIYYMKNLKFRYIQVENEYMKNILTEKLKSRYRKSHREENSVIFLFG